MCTSLRVSVIFLGCLFLSIADAAPQQKAGKEPEWKKLFDGKSLDGWKDADFFNAPTAKVQDGAILMTKGPLMTGIVYARKDFPKMDYEVTLEAKKVEGNDFFCTTTFPFGETHCSLVVGGWTNTVVGLSSIDFNDASINETRKDMKFKNDVWYNVRIRVSKNRIEAWIDKDKVVDFDTTDRDISLRIECNACRPFGVATYETTGLVRDIRVRTLSEAEKKKIAETEPEKK